MNDEIRLLALAQLDLDRILFYIAARSPKGAARQLARFEAAMARLEENPFVAPVAPESSELDEEVRDILFRTRAGRTDRALFVVVGNEVRILRVRGPGQAPLEPYQRAVE